MNKFNAAVLSTCLLATASAFAQSDSQRAEMFRQNTDMMIPPAIAAGSFDRATPRPASRVSESQRKADAFIASTDMMIPPAIAASVGNMASSPSRRSPMASSVDEGDRRMAEIMQRTDRMKPN
jgi:hypothetical protein